MEERRFANKIDWFTFLFSILVIWTHSYNSELFMGRTQANVVASRIEYFLGYTISQIAVPGFFMISAYLFYRGFQWEKLWIKWESRVRSVLIPFITWNSLYYLGYVTASRLPVLKDVVGRGTVPLAPEEMVEAVLRYAYNPVFWYLYQLILLVLAAPALYAILRRRLTAALWLALLLWALIMEWSLPQLNLDALFYYSAAAGAAIHGRGWVERGWNKKKCAVGALAALFCLLVYRSPSPPAATVLFRLLAVASLWLMVDERLLLPARGWMKNNFFLYAVHFALVRLINKGAAMAFPHEFSANLRQEDLPFLAVPLLLYLFMPALLVFVSFYSGRAMKRWTPRLWNLLNGFR